VLSRDNFRRLYMRAVTKTTTTSGALGPTDTRVLGMLTNQPGQTAKALGERAAATGRPLRLATIGAALLRLEVAGLAVASGDDTLYWSPLPPRSGPLSHLELSGAHDLRHTFATWLEDAGIPARVIDELMGHAGSRRAEPSERGSTVGRVYRHTTPEMARPSGRA
jgi:integrase